MNDIIDLVFKASVLFGSIVMPALLVSLWINQKKIIKLYSLVTKHLGEDT
jgi:hypothetical protein